MKLRKIRQYGKLSMLAIFSLVLLISPALASNELTVVRSISDTSVEPGSTVTVTLALSANVDLNGPIINETYPDGWVLSENDNGGFTHRIYGQNRWLYLGEFSAGSQTKIVYDITVPLGTEEGDYNFTGDTVAVVDNNYSSGITTIGDSQVTVTNNGGPTSPTADFSVNTSSGKAPLSVKFTDLSTGSVSSWQWDFDNDGVVDSTDQNPVYTYTEADEYTVKLTVSGSGGSSTETKTSYISVTNDTTFTADFTVNDTAGYAPLTVKFTDLSTGDISSWKWDFDNDGVVDSTEQNPVYKYTETGTYTVSLLISDGEDSATEIKSDYIKVTDEGSYDATEATAVSLSATIIPALSIEVTPGALDFGTLAAGETSDELTMHIKNKGATDAEVTVQVTDVAKGLYEAGLKLDSGNWEGYAKLVDSGTTESVQASLCVPDDFIGIGAMEGKIVFWAEIN